MAYLDMQDEMTKYLWQSKNFVSTSWVSRLRNKKFNNWFTGMLDNSFVGRNFRAWGLKGAAGAFLKGAGSAIGFNEGKFMGAGAVGRGAGVMGLGYAAYRMTGSIGMGLGVGAGAMYALKGNFMAVMGPGWTALSMLKGFKEGGLAGGLSAGAHQTLSWGGFELGMGALKVAFKGTRVGALATGIGGLGKGVLMSPVAWIVAGLAIGAYKAVTGFARIGRRSQLSHFVGNMQAFRTEQAYTMRQRALQEISRSHTNARTILGGEASLMHL